jgi:hypothetical protein
MKGQSWKSAVWSGKSPHFRQLQAQCLRRARKDVANKRAAATPDA